jgi:tetratricopeptide (TPR) repeat protein
MFSRRQYRPALKAYQTVLAYSPDFLPDPRISIGLCYHMLKDFDTARKCWERSVIVVSPTILPPYANLTRVEFIATASQFSFDLSGTLAWDRVIK